MIGIFFLFFLFFFYFLGSFLNLVLYTSIALWFIVLVVYVYIWYLVIAFCSPVTDILPPCLKNFPRFARIQFISCYWYFTCMVQNFSVLHIDSIKLHCWVVCEYILQHFDCYFTFMVQNFSVLHSDAIFYTHNSKLFYSLHNFISILNWHFTCMVQNFSVLHTNSVSNP